MSWLIKKAIHAVGSVAGGRGLALCRVSVKVVSKPEPVVLQELCIFSSLQALGMLARIMSEMSNWAWQ